jgi:hypothetical protein
LFQEHDVLNLLKEFFFESCILLDEQKVFFFEFFGLFGLELKLLLIVSGLVNEEKFILVKIDTFLFFHNLLVDIFVGLFSKDEISSHFFEDFAECNKEIILDLFNVGISELAVVLEPLLNGFVEVFEVFDELLVRVRLGVWRGCVLLGEVLVELLHGLLWIHGKGLEEIGGA